MADFDLERYGQSTEADEVSRSQPLWIEVLRWVGVLPGAILGARIIHILSKFGMWLTSSRFGDDTWFDLIRLRFLKRSAKYPEQCVFY